MSTNRGNLTPGPKWMEVNRGLHPLLISRNVALLQRVIGKAQECYLFQIIIRLLNLISPSPPDIIFISRVSSAYFCEKFSPSSPSPSPSFSMILDQPVQFSAIIFRIQLGRYKHKAQLWAWQTAIWCDANNKRHCSMLRHLTTLAQLIQPVTFLCFPLHDSVVNVKTEDAQVPFLKLPPLKLQSRLLEHLWVSWRIEQPFHTENT